MTAHLIWDRRQNSLNRALLSEHFSLAIHPVFAFMLTSRCGLGTEFHWRPLIFPCTDCGCKARTTVRSRIVICEWTISEIYGIDLTDMKIMDNFVALLSKTLFP